MKKLILSVIPALLIAGSASADPVTTLARSLQNSGAQHSLSLDASLADQARMEAFNPLLASGRSSVSTPMALPAGMEIQANDTTPWADADPELLKEERIVDGSRFINYPIGDPIFAGPGPVSEINEPMPLPVGIDPDSIEPNDTNPWALAKPDVLIAP